MNPKPRSTRQTVDEATAIRLAQASIDLHEAAAKILADLAPGTSDVDVERLAATLKLIGEFGTLTAPQSGALAREPVQVGRFQVLKERGRGGFGVVLHAYDPDLEREVALKIPLPEKLLTGQSPEEFVREARLAARLEHPGVVRVYEVARLGPIWYIVSAYCAGPTLAEWLEQRREPLSPKSAARVVAAIAEAVHYAHSRGVLHLDLKPENVLVEDVPEEDHPLRPMVTDFGLAGRLEQFAADGDRRLGGTVDYMAPEQRLGDAGRVGVAADVYALGAILYDLVAKPFPRETMDDPSQGASLNPSPRPSLAALPRDFDAICQRCLQPEIENRYASADELAADLGRFIEGLPVRARHAPWLERAARWSARRPITAALLGALLSSLALGLGTAGLLWHRAEQHLAETRSLLYAANIKLAEGAWAEHNIRALNMLLAPFADIDDKGDDLRGWEWYYFQRLCHQDQQTFTVAGEIECSAIAPSGQILITGTSDGRVAANDVATGHLLWSLRPFAGHLTCIAVSQDGSRFAALDRRGNCQLWQNLRKPRLVAHTAFSYGTIQAAAFNRELTFVALSDPAYTIHCWNFASDCEVQQLNGHTANVTALVMLNDGEQLASSSEDGSVRVWNIQTGKQDRLFEDPAKDRLLSIAATRDGRYVAAGGRQGMVLSWDLDQGSLVFHRPAHADAVNCLRFTAGGESLISASGDRSIKVFKFRTAELQHAFWGHEERVSSLMITGDSDQFLATSRDGAVKAWNLKQPDIAAPTPLYRNVGNAVFSPQGESLAFRFTDGRVCVFQWPQMQINYQFQGPAGLDALAYDSGQRLCAVSRDDGAVEIWRAERLVRTIEHHQLPVRSLAFDRDGKRLAVAGREGVISIWDPLTGAMIHQSQQEREVVSVAFAPGDAVLAASVDNLIKLFDVPTGQLQRRINTLSQRVYGIAFSGDGSLLAAGDRSGSILVWDTKRNAPVAKLTGHSDRVYACCITPDKRRLVSCSRDSAIRWWDLTTGHELCVIRGDWGECENLILSPDGWALLSIGKDKALRIWEPRELSRRSCAAAM